VADDLSAPQIAARIEALLGRFATSPDPAVRDGSHELVSLLMRLYGAGLERILRTVEEKDGRDGDAMRALAQDELVSSLLVLHDLHPDDVPARISRELDRFRAIAGADLSLLSYADGVARVHVRGGRATRAPGAAELRRLLEEVVRGVAPETTRVDVDGLEPSTAPLVQLTMRGGSASRNVGAS